MPGTAFLRAARALAWLAPCACAQETVETTRALAVIEEVVVERRLAQRPESLDDTLGLYLTTDLAEAADGFVVLDSGNDRMVRFSWALEPQEVWGSAGEGPGELQGPLRVARAGDRLFVGDPGNLRVSIYDATNGRFVGVVPTPDPANQLAAAADGSILLRSARSDFYLVRMAPDGSVGDFASIPPDLRDPEEGRSAFFRTHGVAVSDDGSVHVLDQNQGVLLTYDPMGRLVRRSALPAPLWAELTRRAQRGEEALGRAGHRPLGRRVIKRLIPTARNQLLILYSGERSVALLVDAATHEARILRRPEREPGRTDLWRLTAALLRGDTLLGLYGEALSTFLLRPAA